MFIPLEEYYTKITIAMFPIKFVHDYQEMQYITDD